MTVADILRDVGRGALTGVRTVGAISQPILERTTQVLSGEAPQIDEEQRQQAAKFDDAALNAKADELESQLEMGRKYGTLTPQQQDQYVTAISNLFSHPRHMNTLMTRLQRAIHPNGATYQPNEPLPNATPSGGTVGADMRMLDEKQGLRPVPGVHPFQNKEDGQWYQPMYNRMGQVVNQLIEGYTPPAPKTGAGKTPPTPGNQLPVDAVGPDGSPIPEFARTVAQSYIGYEGKWYPAPKPKPVFKTIKGHSVLVDPQTGAIERDLGPMGTSRITSHQVPFLGDDGQMHLLTTYSVSTPQGETIDVEAPAPDTGQAAPNLTQQKASVKKPGTLLPRTGAKTPMMGSAIPGSRAWAQSKSLEGKSISAQYTKAAEDATSKKLAYENASGLLADNSRQTDLELVYAWVRANVQGAGRMTNTEITQTAKAGSWGTRVQNAIDQASTGRLAPQLEQQFLSDIKRSYDNAQKEADDLKGQLGGSPPAVNLGTLLPKTGAASGEAIDWNSLPSVQQ